LSRCSHISSSFINQKHVKEMVGLSDDDDDDAIAVASATAAGATLRANR
jgi:hypothetical protein